MSKRKRKTRAGKESEDDEDSEVSKMDFSGEDGKIFWWYDTFLVRCE